MGQLAKIFSGVVMGPGAPEKIVHRKSSQPAIPVRSVAANFLGSGRSSAEDFIIFTCFFTQITALFPASRQ
jgi:hypothetical protein